MLDAHHVEVQVVGDGEGGALVVGERECSVQRRHQKLLEESPSPFVFEETRRRLYDAALGAVRATRYRNAGTIECLLGGDQSFYFMEMNTRLQVEHPVSEEVTGIDLVRTQLRLAMGEPLPAQGIAPTHGHAIEFRVNAEDPSRGFMPSPGPLKRFRPPLGRGVRVDTHAYEGYTVPPTYDSLMAKLIVSDDTRDLVLGRAAQALAEFEIEGVSTTLPLFREMVGSEPAFRSGALHDGLPRAGGGAAILVVRVMTDTQPGAVSRRQARRAAFVLTYQLDVRAGSDIEELSARYLADTGMEVPDYTREVVEGVQRDRLAIDADVDAAAAGWTSDRLGAVERSILRLATWELRQGELPPAVVIDEAMELAKRYAGAEAAPFVNGVLGAIARGGEESR